jgi:hypothetical protein
MYPSWRSTHIGFFKVRKLHCQQSYTFPHKKYFRKTKSNSSYISNTHCFQTDENVTHVGVTVFIQTDLKNRSSSYDSHGTSPIELQSRLHDTGWYQMCALCFIPWELLFCTHEIIPVVFTYPPWRWRQHSTKNINVFLLWVVWRRFHYLPYVVWEDRMTTGLERIW